MQTNFADFDNEFESDSFGKVLDTNVYDATIKYVYLTESKSKTTGLNVVLDIDGKEINPDTIWITYKDGVTHKVIEGKKVTPPGLRKFNDLAYCALGVTLKQLGEPENKPINLYNYEQQKKVPTMCPCYPTLSGKKIQVGLRKFNKHKSTLVGSTYVPTTTTYYINVVDKFYTPEGKLAIEQVSNKEAAYKDKWLNANKGKVFEEDLKGVTPIAANGNPAANSNESPAKSLGFD